MFPLEARPGLLLESFVICLAISRGVKESKGFGSVEPTVIQREERVLTRKATAHLLIPEMVTRVLEIEMMALVREARDLTEAFHRGKRLSVKMQKRN